MKTYPIGESISFYFTSARIVRRSKSVLDAQVDLAVDIAWVYEYPDEDEETDEEVYNLEYFSKRIGITL
jgi:hypothetical protein